MVQNLSSLDVYRVTFTRLRQRPGRSKRPAAREPPDIDSDSNLSDPGGSSVCPSIIWKLRPSVANSVALQKSLEVTNVNAIGYNR